MNALRIMHLLACPTLTGPGAAALPMILAARDAGADLRVVIDGHRPDDLAHVLRGHGIFTDESLAMSTVTPPWKTLNDIHKLRQCLKRWKPDAVVTHTSHDHVLAWLGMRGLSRNVPLIRTLHSKRSLQKRTGQRWLWRRTDAVLSHVQGWEDKLRDRFDIPTERFFYTPLPIETGMFSPHGPDLREKLGFPPDVPTLGVVCRIKPGRRLFPLLAAMRSVGRELGVRLVVVGAGESAGEAENLCRHWGLREYVRFMGYLRTPVLAAAYRTMDALLLAAEGNDGSCRVLAEAACCGVPAIGFSGIAAVREQVTPGETGEWFEVPGNTAYSWRKAFEKVLRAFVRRKNWSELGACARAARLSLPDREEIGDRWLEFIQTLQSAGKRCTYSWF